MWHYFICKQCIKLAHVIQYNVVCQVATEVIENIRTVAALSLEDKFSGDYSELVDVPVR